MQFWQIVKIASQPPIRNCPRRLEPDVLDGLRVRREVVIRLHLPSPFFLQPPLLLLRLHQERPIYVLYT